LRQRDRGEIIAAVDDAHHFTTREGPPDFAVVELPGVPLRLAKRLAEANLGPTRNKRIWRIVRSAISTTARARLAAGHLHVGTHLTRDEFLRGVFEQSSGRDAKTVGVRLADAVRIP